MGGGPEGPGPPPSCPRGGGGRDGARGTSLLGRLVVCLADQPAVLHEVELVAGGQLPFADDAGEAVQVVNEVLGPAHHLGRGDALLAGGTLRPEAPERGGTSGGR